jgi:hypothetical protein
MDVAVYRLCKRTGEIYTPFLHPCRLSCFIFLPRKLLVELPLLYELSSRLRALNSLLCLNFKLGAKAGCNTLCCCMERSINGQRTFAKNDYLWVSVCSQV